MPASVTASSVFCFLQLALLVFVVVSVQTGQIQFEGWGADYFALIVLCDLAYYLSVGIGLLKGKSWAGHLFVWGIPVILLFNLFANDNVIGYVVWGVLYLILIMWIFVDGDAVQGHFG